MWSSFDPDAKRSTADRMWKRINTSRLLGILSFSPLDEIGENGDDGADNRGETEDLYGI